MKKTGELLKQKRESANLSVGEVALATKINPKILTAIENGDETNLPAKTFLKGFVRSYALFLKLNVDEVMRQFAEETGGTPTPAVHEAYRQPEPTTANGAPAPARRRPPPGEGSAGMRTVAIVVIVLLIGLIIGVRELIEKYQKEKIVTTGDVKVSPLVTPPMVPEPAVQVTPDSVAAKPADETKPDETAKPEGPATKVEVPVKAPEVAAPVGAPIATEPKHEAKPVEAKVEKPVVPVVTKTEPAKTEPAKKEPVAKAATAPPPAVVAATTPDATAAKPVDQPLKSLKNEIILEALDKVDVEFKVHGETRRFSLGPTQVHTIRTDGPVVLDLSDGGAVNIIINGQERGVPGDLGKPKQVKLP